MHDNLTLMPGMSAHWPAGARRCLRFFTRAWCSCGWATWPRRSPDAAGAVLDRHMILADAADAAREARA